MSVSSPVLIKRTYPWSEEIDGHQVSFRPMLRDDHNAVLSLARSLPDVDLAFLRIDITQPDVVDEWIENLEIGRTVTILAEIDGRVIGYGSLHHNEQMWTSHLGEIRILVAPEYRGLGIGGRLGAEMFHIATEMKLIRVICQIPADKPRVRQMFERMGFQCEAILREWLKGRDGSLHDLIIMSHYTDDFGA